MNENDCKKIMSLYQRRGKLKAELTRINMIRERACALEIIIKYKNPSGYADEGYKLVRTFEMGKVDDLSAIILGRSSDALALDLRVVENELRDLGAEL